MIRKRLHALISMLRWTTLWRPRWPASCHPQPISRRLLPWRWRCVCKDINDKVMKGKGAIFNQTFTFSIRSMRLLNPSTSWKPRGTSCSALVTTRRISSRTGSSLRAETSRYTQSLHHDLDFPHWIWSFWSFFPSFIYDVLSWFMQLMTDTVGNPEEERRTEFYHSNWVTEAVGRYIFSKVSA